MRYAADTNEYCATQDEQHTTNGVVRSIVDENRSMLDACLVMIDVGLRMIHTVSAANLTLLHSRCPMSVRLRLMIDTGLATVDVDLVMAYTHPYKAAVALSLNVSRQRPNPWFFASLLNNDLI